MRFVIIMRVKKTYGRSVRYTETELTEFGFSVNSPPIIFGSMQEAQFVANGFNLRPDIEYVVRPYEIEGVVE